MSDMYDNNGRLKSAHFTLDDLKITDSDDELHSMRYSKYPFNGRREPLEPERIRAIHQQAYLYHLLYTFAKEHMPAVKETTITTTTNNNNSNSNSKSTDTTMDSIRDKVLKYLLDLQPDKANNSPALAPTSNNDQASKLWNGDELAVLRSNHAQIKEVNMRLSAELHVLRDEKAEWRRRYDELSERTARMPNALATFEKENQRLYIRVQELEMSYAGYLSELSAAHHRADELQAERNELRRLVDGQSADKSRLEYEAKKLEMRLACVESELRLSFEQRLERAELAFAKELRKRDEQVEHWERVCERERRTNAKNEKALSQLRDHFVTATGRRSGRSRDRIEDANISAL